MRYLPLAGAAALLGAAVIACPCQAQTHAVGAITMVRTGWNAEVFAVVLNVPVQNPAGCATPDGYLTEGSLPGYRTYLASALTAYANKSPVQVVVDNRACLIGRPKLIGINLTR